MNKVITPTGFVDIQKIIPNTVSRNWMSVDAFKSNNLRFNPSLVANLEKSLESRVCLLLGLRDRGKTFLSKLLGLRFLHNLRHERIPTKYAFYGRLSDIDLAEAMRYFEDNNNHTMDRYFFVIDDCHTDPSKSESLFERLTNYESKSARLLVISRPVSAIRSAFTRNVGGEPFTVVPDRELLEQIIRLYAQHTPPSDVSRAVDRIISTVTSIPDLTLVEFTIRLAEKESKSVAEVTQDDVLRKVVDETLRDPLDRKVFLTISAISQFDIPVYAPFVEDQADKATVKELLNEGQITRNVTHETLTYELDHPGHASIYLLAAANSQLLEGGGDLKDYTRTQIVKYIEARAPNFVGTLTGAVSEPQFGLRLLQELVMQPSVRENIAVAASKTMDQIWLTTLLKLVKQADREAAREILQRYVCLAGSGVLVNAVLSSTIMIGSRLMATCIDLDPALRSSFEEISGELIGEKLTKIAGGATFVTVLTYLQKCPILLRKIFSSGAITSQRCAEAIRGRRLHRTRWMLRIVQQYAPTSSPKGLGIPNVSEIVALLGGAVWAKKIIRQEPNSVVGRFLYLLQKTSPEYFREIVDDLDIVSIANKVTNARGLIKILEVLPRRKRDDLLTYNLQLGLAGLARRSSISSLVSLVEHLSFRARSKLNTDVIETIVGQLGALRLSDTSVGVLGRLLHFTKKISEKSAIMLAKEYSKLSISEISQAVSREKTKKPEKLGKLLSNMRHTDIDSAREFAEKVSMTATASIITQESLNAFQYIVYFLSMVNSDLAARWVRDIPDVVIQKKVDEADFTTSLWTLWNLFRADTNLGERLIRWAVQSESFRVQYLAAPQESKLAMNGLIFITLGASAVLAIGSNGARARLGDIDSPELRILVVLGTLGNGERRDRVSLERGDDWEAIEAALVTMERWKSTAPSCYARLKAKFDEFNREKFI